METIANSASDPSTSGKDRLLSLLNSTTTLATDPEVRGEIAEIVKELTDEEQLGLQEIINEIDEVAPLDITTHENANFVSKLGMIYSHVGLLPKSIGSFQGLEKASKYSYGTGGTTDVWRCNLDGENVAAKAFRIGCQPRVLEDLMEILSEVAPAWKRLKHDNVLPFHGVTINELFSLALVYDWGQKCDIGKYLESAPDASRSELLFQVAKGLQYLHSVGIVHGNLKGRNVVISGSGHAQVCDYDLEPLMRNRAFMDAATPRVVGFSHWIAPELIDPPTRPAEVSKRTDVFAFAMLAVEVYTGDLPFGKISPEAAIMRIVNGQRPDKPEHQEVTEDMWKLIQECWNQKPEDRPDIDEVVRRWERFVNGGSLVRTTPDGKPGKNFNLAVLFWSLLTLTHIRPR